MNLPAVIEYASEAVEPAPMRRVPWRAFGCCLFLLIAADRLLFNFQPGISLVLFLLMLAVCMPIANDRTTLQVNRWHRSTPVLLAALAPLVEAVNSLTILVGLVGFGLFVIVLGGGTGSIWRKIGLTLSLPLSGPIRLPRAIATAVRNVSEHRPKTAQLTYWLLPICVGLVFVFLLQSANPIIERWIAQIDILLLALFENLGLWRAVFWLAVAAFCWPFLQLRLSANGTSPFAKLKAYFGLTHETEPAGAESDGQHSSSLMSRIVAPIAITRSLVLFNGVFAVQSALDLTYLWGGADLPEGMTYAGYAHRGAYPLVATALLAGGFVLLALRPNSGMEARPLTRNLILLFAAQNVMLMVSSILRLDLYVAEYSLTQLRLAALVWMGLVAFGLTLIFLRVTLRKNNRWLIDWNLRALLATLYACGLINTTNLIAGYNVDHSYEVTGSGTRLDTGYLLCLGAEAIPALDRFVEAELKRAGYVEPSLKERIQDTATEFDISMDHWQSWTFRRSRLMQYLKDAGHVWP